MVNKLLHMILLLFALSGAAQETAVLKGQVVSGRAGVNDAFVINKSSGKETQTNASGMFSITARQGDVLVVYNTKIMVREFKLSADSFKSIPYIISVNYKAAELDEVVITKYGNINSVGLGIVPENQKRYTVAERRLFTAGYGSIGLIALINVISGRMKMLKRALATEKQEMVLESIKELYEEEDIQEQFNIPGEHVKGFMYYLVENENFVIAVKGKNKSYIDFLMMERSKEYLKLQETTE